MPLNLDDFLQRAETADVEGWMRPRGRVCAVEGCLVRIRMPGGRLGHWVVLEPPDGAPGIPAQITGFDQDAVWCSPAASISGIGPDWGVSLARTPGIPASENLLGRILDGLGRPMDGAGPISAGDFVPLDAPAPDPLTRPPVEKPFVTGIRAIDGLCTLAAGQRIGLFAGPGVGKSHLLGQLARQSDAAVKVVCLVGERGREVREFLGDNLRGCGDFVMVAATSDAPALARALAPLAATAVAEFFRDRGGDVLLLVDSLTRMVRALREITLQMGQAPARRGYPPAVFAGLPRLIERAGTSPRGTITAIYTVLVEGNDLDEPVSDEVRGLLDGHLILSRRLAESGHYPALDIPRSLSRLASRVISSERRALAARIRAQLAVRQESDELVRMGAVVPGAHPLLDEALACAAAVDDFLRQGAESVPFEATWEEMRRLVSGK